MKRRKRIKQRNYEKSKGRKKTRQLGIKERKNTSTAFPPRLSLDAFSCPEHRVEGIGVVNRQGHVTCSRPAGLGQQTLQKQRAVDKTLMLSDEGKCSAVLIPWLRRERQTTGSSTGSPPLKHFATFELCYFCVMWHIKLLQFLNAVPDTLSQ